MAANCEKDFKQASNTDTKDPPEYDALCKYLIEISASGEYKAIRLLSLHVPDYNNINLVQRMFDTACENNRIETIKYIYGMVDQSNEWKPYNIDIKKMTYRQTISLLNGNYDKEVNNYIDIEERIRIRKGILAHQTDIVKSIMKINKYLVDDTIMHIMEYL